MREQPLEDLYQARDALVTAADTTRSTPGEEVVAALSAYRTVSLDLLEAYCSLVDALRTHAQHTSDDPHVQVAAAEMGAIHTELLALATQARHTRDTVAQLRTNEIARHQQHEPADTTDSAAPAERPHDPQTRQASATG